MKGLHLIGDLHDCACPPSLLLAADALEAICVGACAEAGLTPVGRLVHGFTDGDGAAAGVTCAVLLAESHLCLHTWPETASVTLDLYVCNFSGDNRLRARRAYAAIVERLLPRRNCVQEIERGELPRPAA